MKLSFFSSAAVAALCAAGPAAAHVVLEYQVAPAGHPYKATFKVGHGCGSAATRQVSVSIPPGVTDARPMPKPGWSVEVVRQALPQPVTRHGRTVTEDVAQVTWTARTPGDHLPSDQYDEFVLVARTPERPGTIHWPVQQVCEAGRLDWAEVPAPGQKAADLRYPAARLEILPAGNGGHQH
jgi:uncharacterized protein YcnI